MGSSPQSCEDMGLGSVELSWYAVPRAMGDLLVEGVTAGLSVSLLLGVKMLCLGAWSLPWQWWRPCKEEECGCPGRRVQRMGEVMKMRREVGYSSCCQRATLHLLPKRKRKLNSHSLKSLFLRNEKGGIVGYLEGQ